MDMQLLLSMFLHARSNSVATYIAEALPENTEHDAHTTRTEQQLE